jgi:3-oxoacyl-[acyl-carrier protein] reductase
VLEPSSFLDGKVAWVTGSSRGIGRVVAAYLASRGARVVVHGTSPTSTRAFEEADSLEAVAREIGTEHGVEVSPVHGDLADPRTVERVVGEIHARFERVDVLVACAGGDIGAAGTGGPGAGKPDPNDAVFISLDDVRAVLDRNLMSCILSCRAVAPEMMQRREGRIVTVSSVDGLHGVANGSLYATAKAAVIEYSRCLAVQLRPYNVPVNVVAPGGVLTPRFRASRTLDDARVASRGALEGYGEPLDIARAVGFLVSEGGRYISGQVLRVDGGAQAWPA